MGGLVGNAHLHSYILNSFTKVNVSGESQIGGMAGVCYNSSVSQSGANGTVSGSLNSVGGLIGIASMSTIDTSYANCNVKGGEQIGGLVGYNYNTSI